MGRTDRESLEERENTRTRIVAATARHLARLGPRSVELRAICVELGVSPSLVNYHFESSGQLLWEAALHGYAEHVDRQVRVVSEAPDGVTALKAWIDGVITWKRSSTGVAAVIDYPMLAFSDEDAADVEEYAPQVSDLSRRNVAALGSAVYAAMTGRPVRMLSATRVALLIRRNREFAFWISTAGFGTQGSATWIAGRRPYGPVWRAFGFSPDRQIKSVVEELLRRMGGTDLPAVDEP